jgi:D-alanyl-lipoteichoic acid acyltransferase DltB (MBOAT superfamily)
LLAGPILHHKEMMPQFADASNRLFKPDNFARGLFLLALGFGKKVLVADPLGAIANAGYSNIDVLGFSEAWMTTFAYTFQIYFDFSGYTDMALGAALMFNIRLPVNFNSPYHAANIQDFWRRWHITLSRFLRDYLYIPLGGNKSSDMRVATHVVATFLLGGLWHGAGWTFIVWGGLHGTALLVFRGWQRAGFRLYRIAAILLTFIFVHLTWVFFRAASLNDAMRLLRKLLPVGMNWSALQLNLWPVHTAFGLPYTAPSIEYLLLAALVLTLLPFNSDRLASRFVAKKRDSIWAAMLLTLGTLTLGQVSQFLYFNF